MKPFLYLLLAVTMLTAAPVAMNAQTSARLTGTVTDSSHAHIHGAVITAVNLSTGQQRQDVTGEDGTYVLTELPIGVYKVTASHQGFESKSIPSVTLGVSEVVTFEFSLTPSSVEQSVTVEAGSEPLIDTTTSLGATLNTHALSQLPINGRDYARFALLTPGAVATTNILANISFNGQQIEANRFSIDGVDASRVDFPYIANGSERGARLLTGSIETIAEFRALTGVYPAEYGRASSGYVTIATKSGGNQIHGTAYNFLRNNLFDARNYFNTKGQQQAAFRFNNFGGSVGGPIRRNKDFFFLNYEGSRQIIGITGTGTTPSALLRQEVLSTSPSLAQLLALFPIGTSTTSNPLIDSYTTNQPTNVREDTGSARIDHSFSDTNSLFVRFNVNDSYVSGPVDGVYPNSLGTGDHQQVPIRVTNVAVHDQQIVGHSFINEFLAGLQRYNAIISSNEAFPLTTITGLTITPGTRGTIGNANTSYQVGDDMSLVSGAHTIKWGVGSYRVDLDDRALATTTITYTSITDFINNSAYSASQTGANPGSSTRAYQVDSYIQDTWQERPGITIDYGLRWDYQTPAYDPTNKQQAFSIATNTLSPTGHSFYDDTRRDFSPRLGISYAVAPRYVVRAGFGIFYQQYPLYPTGQIVSNNAPGTTSLLRSQVPALSYPLTPYLSAKSGALPASVGYNPTKPDQYAEQWNLSNEISLNNDTTATLAYVGNRTLHLRQNQNINYVNPATGQRPITGFSDVVIELAGGVSNYNAMQAQLTHRIRNGVQASASYTFGHSLDDVQDGAGTGKSLYWLQPQTNNNWAAEYGNGTNDVRHSFNYSITYDLPFGQHQQFLSHAPKGVNLLVSGWQLASLGEIRSGSPVSIFIGTNTSGNGSTTNQRPNRVPGISQYAAHKTVQQWFNPAAFSVPAAGTVGNLARNTVYGPGFKQIDFSFLKRTTITERTKLELRAEIFNLPNTPNFAEPNNTFNTSTFGEILTTYGLTLGNGTARQMQMAAKIVF